MPSAKTIVVKVDATSPEMDRVDVAAGVIREGGLVVFPTETVYGIGADVFNDGACRRIFEVKGRPADNPLIVTVSSLGMAEEVARIPGEYREVIKRVWPSPITFIAEARGNLPETATSGLDTVALRMPAHPVALALIDRSGTPIAAPSANPSAKPSATSGEQAIRYFNGSVECIMDSGRAFFGVESTIIDLRDFRILRPGPFTIEEIERAFGREPQVDGISRGFSSADAAISPGMKYAHYAPDTPLLLFNGEYAADVPFMVEKSGRLVPFAFVGSEESCSEMEGEGYSTVSLGSRTNMYEIAKNLYDGLISVDSLNVYFGVVESFGEAGIGLALMNRIRKATSNRAFGNWRELSALLDAL